MQLQQLQRKEYNKIAHFEKKTFKISLPRISAVTGVPTVKKEIGFPILKQDQYQNCSSSVQPWLQAYVETRKQIPIASTSSL